jgi:bifunctional non-homologous end joining protein LigD
MYLSYVRPIIPTRIYDIPNFNDPNWIMELKFDGYRAILHIDARTAYFVSRRKRVMAEYDLLAQRIRRELRVRKAIIDGELVALDPETGYSDRSRLKQRTAILAFMAFDLIRHNKLELVGKPLSERRQCLEQLVANKEFIQFVEGIRGKKEARGRLRAMLACGYEGVVIKHLQDLYNPHSARWFKYLNVNYGRPKRS